MNRTAATIKADAARIAFSALGRNVVWAVMDSGIDGQHPHFKTHKTLDLPAPLKHKDFVSGKDDAGKDIDKSLEDPYGHGTHVAGILAGAWSSPNSGGPEPVAYERVRKNQDEDFERWDLVGSQMVGMAPHTKLVSYKVLDNNGFGTQSQLLAALIDINETNEHGKWLQIHGVNLSLGYDFQSEWFACGQSPLCVEVNRLVKSGVVVVVAAGNSGQTKLGPQGIPSSVYSSINDPGNADLAITVGATHRDKPRTYGVSYFSSKGPTGDGRSKPDLVAPGEKVLSCATGERKTAVEQALLVLKPGVAMRSPDYLFDSGTSMAAPHVSGAIAAFLSIRREYIGQPEEVKRIFLNSATDLNRERNFQGTGLLDLMRAIQSV
jgi:serine protease AprX